MIHLLEYRLKLWIFRLDFEEMEEAIVSPLKSLSNAINHVKRSKLFAQLMSHVLAVGNCLNRTDCEGFHLEFLNKVLSTV